MPTQNHWKTAWLSRFLRSQAYTKPTRCLHQPTLATGTKIRMKEWKNERIKKWVVNPITAKRNTLTAFSPSPFGEGRGEAVGVRLLTCSQNVCLLIVLKFSREFSANQRANDCYSTWILQNSLENFFACRKQNTCKCANWFSSARCKASKSCRLM